MPPENNPRAWPLVVAIYGHDVRVVSDPAMLDRELVVHDHPSNEGARLDARRTLRSAELAGSGVQYYRELTVDPRTRAVRYGSMPVRLRKREYELLLHMAHDPERVWTRHELLRDVWHFRAAGTTRTVDSHASRVRRALAAAGAVGWVPATWGVGYRLAP
jgi:DNA-binding response OmpR family regulator